MPTTLLKVRYYAHVGQLTGYGRAATEYAMAMLKHPGFDLDVVPLGEGALDERTKVLMPKIQRGDFTPDVVLVHTLPRDCERVLDAVKIDARATPCAAMTPSSAGRCGGAGETRSPQGGERGTPEPAPDPALASTFPSPTRLPSYPPMTGGSRGDSP